MTELLHRSAISTAEFASNGALPANERPAPIEPATEADTAPEYYAYSHTDATVARHFDTLSLEDQRRRTAVLYHDMNGNEIIDEAAGSYSDYLKEQVSETNSLDEALELYYQHDTDPINAIDLLAHIAEHYAATLHNNPQAQHKIAELTEENVKNVEKVVRGETDHATPEAGLRCMVIAADILAENSEAEAEAAILQRLNKAARISHDGDGMLSNGHMAADPLLAEAISEAISDRLQIPTTAGITLGELVDQHVEIKLLDLKEQDIEKQIEAKQAELLALRNQRSEAASHLKQEVRAAKRPAGIRGLLAGIIKVGR